MAFAGKFENDGVVDKAIDNGACGHVVGKDLSPIRERKIRGDADASAFIAI